MNRFTRFGCMLLALVMLMGFTGCDENGGTDTTSWREPYTAGEEKTLTKDFVDTDGDFKYETAGWNGPEGYVIEAGNNSELNKIAQELNEYFASAFDVTLQIAGRASADKKIVLKVDDALAEGEIRVYVEGNDLIFSAGHTVTLGSAVEKYIRTEPEKGKASVFSLTTDFSATALDGYKYVWGDEFEGSDVDFTKWDFGIKMTGTEKMEVSYDRNVINVEDGRLKLHALRYYNPTRASTQYRVPYSVLTEQKMNYVYGYAEIRCRLPFFKGVWPSFWTQSTDALGGKVSSEFMAEVDIFEVFGQNVIQPGIIKWYRKDGSHAFVSDHQSVEYWTWENTDTIETEYHTYGWEWTPEKMVMNVDGEAYMTFDITEPYDGKSDMSGFHDPMFLMFNNHLITDDSWQTGYIVENSNELLPACYYIDYIRLYQKDGVGKLYTDDTDTSSKYPDRK